jgi:hypothetical protein
MSDEDRELMVEVFEDRFGEGSIDELIDAIRDNARLAIGEGRSKEAGEQQVKSLQEYNMGGAVQLPSTAPGSTDTVPAMLTPGEFVIPRDVVGQMKSGDVQLDGRDLAQISASAGRPMGLGSQGGMR